MGYFSDLDIRIREHGYDTDQLVDSLPPCPLCAEKQSILDIAPDGKSIRVRCTSPCAKSLSASWMLVPSPNSRPAVLREPLSLAEITRQYENGGRVEGVVAIELQEFIDQTLDEINNMLAEALVPGDVLSRCWLADIRYHLVGCDDQVLHIHVDADPQHFLQAARAE